MNDLYYCEKHVIGHDENGSWLFNTQLIYRILLDDNIRNELVEKIAQKISEEKILYDDPSHEVIEYLQKYAISLGVDISNTEDLVAEAFLFLSMKNAGDVDPLTTVSYTHLRAHETDSYLVWSYKKRDKIRRGYRT